MCMLSFIPEGVEINEEDLLNGGLINGDGSGWAIVDKDKILMGKQMAVEDALDEFTKARENSKGAALFHSRWATHGNVNMSNVHPFLVGGSHKTVMAHNGILPCKPDKNDWRSDTRILADEYLQSKYRRFDRPTVMDALSKYIGKGNKLVILTVDDKYKKNHYLVNEDMGNWDELTGIWHSNYDYLGRPKYKFPTYTYTPTYRKNADGVWVPSNSYSGKAKAISSEYCQYCGYGLVGKAGYCIECGTCQDCFEFRKDCECHAHYYRNFDWNQSTIGRKAIEAKSVTNAIDQINAANGESEAQG